MENSLKAIIIGAGVVITLIVVSIGFMLMRSGQDTAKTAMAKMNQVSTEMAESQYLLYDNHELKGSEVVNLIKKFSKDYIGMKVVTPKVSSGTWYVHSADASYNLTTSSNDIKNTSEPSSNQYINPNAMFLCSVKRDANGTIKALEFVQK